jgi:soluble lytic murein transglycosylase-like protein
MRNRMLWILLAVGGFLALTGGTAALAYWKRSVNAAKYLPLLNQAEDRYGIPRDLLARMAYQESRFRDDIITGAKRSSAGAVGIMQIIPRWHPELGEEGARDPYRAVPYAGQYLRSLYGQLGEWKLAVAAYNWGIGNMKAWVADLKTTGTPKTWPTETRKYVDEIFADLG